MGWWSFQNKVTFTDGGLLRLPPVQLDVWWWPWSSGRICLFDTLHIELGCNSSTGASIPRALLRLAACFCCCGLCHKVSGSQCLRVLPVWDPHESACASLEHTVCPFYSISVSSALNLTHTLKKTCNDLILQCCTVFTTTHLLIILCFSELLPSSSSSSCHHGDRIPH